MCGFTAIATLDGSRPDRAVLERMTSVIRHRGPDDGAVEVEGAVGFGFRRLAILDLTPLGHQPMSTPDGQLRLVFNGEIYNYRELRRELEACGHTFRSQGDTEVLLHAYQEWGEGCLAKLNGMWAFLIHDLRRGLVFGSRDRFGEKPLFYHRSGDRMLFASEIKGIRASGAYKTGICWPVAAQALLAARFDIPGPSHETLYEGIHQIPAAHAFELHLDGRWRCWRYWSIDDIGREPVQDPTGQFADLFERSVRLRLRSDVPVGVFLSGGMDSTSIICSMSRQMDGVGSGDKTLRAFCFHAEGFDETSYIADTISMTGAEHTILRTGPLEFWNALDRFLWHHDEPVHSMAALVGYKLMELAASHGVKVVLNGQGADETLGGYGAYFNAYWHSLIAHLRLLFLWREVGEFSEAQGGSRGRLFREALVRFGRSQFHAFPWYRRISSRRTRARLIGRSWYEPELTDHYEPADLREMVGTLDRVLKGSVRFFPLPLYLRIEDRNSMAHSVEGRLPFLDHRLVELVFRLGPEWFLRGKWNKYLLREAMQGRIPESVRTRVDKMGFPTPMADWFRGPLYGPVRDLIASREFRERGIYNIPAIERDLERHRKGEISAETPIWDVVQWEKLARLVSRDPAVIPAAAPSARA